MKLRIAALALLAAVCLPLDGAKDMGLSSLAIAVRVTITHPCEISPDVSA